MISEMAGGWERRREVGKEGGKVIVMTKYDNYQVYYYNI